MSGRVSLSKKSARILAAFERLPMLNQEEEHALEELKRALTPRKPRPLAVASRKAKAEKKASAKERRADVRALVAERAQGRCECGCGRPFTELNPMEWDHFFGRSRAESLQTTWGLAPICHRMKTRNHPSAAAWLSAFAVHCDRNGYAAEAKKARARLEGICAIRRAEAER